MKTLAKFIVRVADLLEAEGRALRESAVTVGIAIAISLTGALIAVGGVAMVAWGLFEAVREATNTIAAAFICGVALILSSGGLLWIAIRLGKGR